VAQNYPFYLIHRCSGDRPRLVTPTCSPYVEINAPSPSRPARVKRPLPNAKPQVFQHVGVPRPMQGDGPAIA